MKPGATLLLRADAGQQIGTGHVMRRLALAQAWQDLGGSVTFASADLPRPLQQRLEFEGISCWRISSPAGSLSDAAETAAAACGLKPDWIVADGYQFDSIYQLQLKQAGWRLLVVDDNGECKHYVADIIVNQNVHASERLYSSRESYTSLLLGSDYALLRREFRTCSARDRDVPAVARRILVTFGGSDPTDLTTPAISGLAGLSIPQFEVVVVVGSANPNAERLCELAKSMPYAVQVVIDPPDMSRLLRWADLGVSAAGATSWEMAYMGVPCIFVIAADNQLPAAKWLEDHNLALHVARRFPDDFPSLVKEFSADRDRRHAAIRRGCELIDGRGVWRVCQRMASNAESLESKNVSA